MGPGSGSGGRFVNFVNLVFFLGFLCFCGFVSCEFLWIV